MECGDELTNFIAKHGSYLEHRARDMLHGEDALQEGYIAVWRLLQRSKVYSDGYLVNVALKRMYGVEGGSNNMTSTETHARFDAMRGRTHKPVYADAPIGDGEGSHWDVLSPYNEDDIQAVEAAIDLEKLLDASGLEPEEREVAQARAEGSNVRELTKTKGRRVEGVWSSARAKLRQHAEYCKPRVSPIRGVTAERQGRTKWRVQVYHKGRNHLGGRFIRVEDANRAAMALRMELEAA